MIGESFIALRRNAEEREAARAEAYAAGEDVPAAMPEQLYLLLRDAAALREYPAQHRDANVVRLALVLAEMRGEGKGTAAEAPTFGIHGVSVPLWTPEAREAFSRFTSYWTSYDTPLVRAIARALGRKVARQTDGQWYIIPR